MAAFDKHVIEWRDRLVLSADDLFQIRYPALEANSSFSVAGSYLARQGDGCPRVTFEPKGGYVRGGLGANLVDLDATFFTDEDRALFRAQPDTHFLFWYDERRPGLAPITLCEAVMRDLEAAENVWTGIAMMSLDDSEAGISGADDADPQVSFIRETREAVAREILRLVRIAQTFPPDRRLLSMRSTIAACQAMVGKDGSIHEPDAVVPFSPVAVREARRCFERIATRFDALGRIREDQPADVLVEPASPFVHPEEISPADRLRDEGVDPAGQVIVHIPGERPYLRPTGWMARDGFAWRLGAGFFHDETGLLGVASDQTVYVRGRKFTRFFDEWTEGSLVEDVDYILTASAVLNRLAGHAIPGWEAFAQEGVSPFNRGPAQPVGERYAGGPSPRRDGVGLRLDGVLGDFSPVGGLRSLILSRAMPSLESRSFRSRQASHLRIFVPAQDFADTDVLRAVRRRLLGFLGPRTIMLPQVLKLCGFDADPLGRPFTAPDHGAGGEEDLAYVVDDPDLVIDLASADAEHLAFLRQKDREKAAKADDPIERMRIDKAIERMDREAVRIAPGPSFPTRLRPDIVEAMQAFEETMRAKGAELIAVSDPAAVGRGGDLPDEQRHPWSFGFLPGGLLDNPVDVSPSREAIWAAFRAFNWHRLLEAPARDLTPVSQVDHSDAALVAEHLQEDEVLFSEFAYLMGSQEFRRRVAVLNSNGVSDLVAPTWRKVDRPGAYASDRYSPFVATDDAPVAMPFRVPGMAPGHSLRSATRIRSDQIANRLVWTGWGLGAFSSAFGANDVSEEELRGIVEQLYPA